MAIGFVLLPWYAFLLFYKIYFDIWSNISAPPYHLHYSVIFQIFLVYLMTLTATEVYNVK
jgi:hypothetical protein